MPLDVKYRWHLAQQKLLRAFKGINQIHGARQTTPLYANTLTYTHSAPRGKISFLHYKEKASQLHPVYHSKHYIQPWVVQKILNNDPTEWMSHDHQGRINHHRQRPIGHFKRFNTIGCWKTVDISLCLSFTLEPIRIQHLLDPCVIYNPKQTRPIPV